MCLIFHQHTANIQYKILYTNQVCECIPKKERKKKMQENRERNKEKKKQINITKSTETGIFDILD